ncbi:hypothetical protein L1987_57266 [Smallanthus sonchifolius]|uniref:Uncharacterized protein n=1 Tax=Smallanthus sonchifolius TaxID=185202 RepID=A0ACB9DCM2_9ASTR|nr:hypothetical protein L1987_57266 [Smallanthus sonchifolius]
MVFGGDSFTVKVVDKVLVSAEEPWNDHWLPFTNFDLLVPPFDVGSTFFYKKPSHGTFPTIADVELKELNLYNPDECIEDKLMPKKLLRGVLAIQVTKLKCEGIVIGVMVDHRIVDGYSANMFISSWADMTRSKTPSMIPSFGRSYLKPRSPTVYSSLIDNVFATFVPPSSPDNGLSEEEDDEYVLVNRIYYIKGEQLKRLQLLASENGCRTSKLVAFTSFLWKEVALSMEEDSF